MTEATTATESPRQIVDQINRAWLNNHPEQIRDYLHPDIVMAMPGFAGSSQGADHFIAGFTDFCTSARISSYSESDDYVDSVGPVSIVSYRFDMVYERAGSGYRCTGRDMWILTRQGDRPVAVWRTMLDLDEQPLQGE